MRLSGEEGCVGDDVKGWGLDGVEGEPQFRLRKLMRAGALWLWDRSGRWKGSCWSWGGGGIG